MNGGRAETVSVTFGEGVHMCEHVSFCGLAGAHRKLWLTSVPTSTSGYTEHFLLGSRPQISFKLFTSIFFMTYQEFQHSETPYLLSGQVQLRLFEEAAVEVATK